MGIQTYIPKLFHLTGRHYLALAYLLYLSSFASLVFFILPGYQFVFVWPSSTALHAMYFWLSATGSLLLGSSLLHFALASNTRPGHPKALAQKQNSKKGGPPHHHLPWVDDMEKDFYSESESTLNSTTTNPVPSHTIIEIGTEKREPFMEKTIMVKNNGEHRYCRKCLIQKPDRTHHCRQCNLCVLKMDHHCPWINNCVGYYNQKYFILLLYSTLLYTVFMLSVSFPLALKLGLAHHYTHPCFLNASVVTVVSLVFGFLFVAFTRFHTWMLLTNRTTIEVFEKRFYMMANSNANPLQNPFDLGWKQNWMQVMGPTFTQSFLPGTEHLNDGESFPVRLDILVSDVLNDKTHLVESIV